MMLKPCLLAAPLLLLAPVAGAGPVQICPGTYAASWGNVTLSSGGTMLLAGTPGSTRLTLSVPDCDTAVLEGDGQRMVLTRQGPDHFQGRLDGGGAQRVFDVHFTTPAQAVALM